MKSKVKSYSMVNAGQIKWVEEEPLATAEIKNIKNEKEIIVTDIRQSLKLTSNEEIRI